MGKGGSKHFAEACEELGETLFTSVCERKMRSFLRLLQIVFLSLDLILGRKYTNVHGESDYEQSVCECVCVCQFIHAIIFGQTHGAVALSNRNLFHSHTLSVPRTPAQRRF